MEDLICWSTIPLKLLDLMNNWNFHLFKVKWYNVIEDLTMIFLRGFLFIAPDS